MEFGYFPHSIDEKFGSISIYTLPNLKKEISRLEKCKFVYNGWFFAPREVWVDMDTSKRDERPYNRRLFNLPKTHVIEHEHTDDESHLSFIVRCLGFLVGMRLSTGANDFLDNTTIRKNSLCDFVYSKNELIMFLEKVDEYWNRHGENFSNRIMTIIHLYQMAQRQNLLNYESFIHLYMAIDAIYRLYLEMNPSVGKANSHAKRVSWLCQELGLVEPSWATMIGKGSALSMERNDVFHEGQTKDGKTVGYSLIDQDMIYGMTHFISRALFPLLPIKCKYSGTAVDTRQTHGLDFVY